ncbi:polyphosphate polymerase domain-containing protein [Micromonospora sp. DT81.3]|uniref:polyphosphate polymerase domain-containing protein n=1 Tax=Micromonospora sp. DT81.3 TaxID=3416523 RepID=UPI003CEB28FF
MRPPSLDRFAPIGLEELVAESALLTRVDRKYVVPLAEASMLLERLNDGMRVLELGGLRDFAYESIYFDTPDLLSFRMAAQPRRRRFKLRTRTYLDTQASFLEVKTRGARSATVKDRIPYELSVRDRLTGDARDYAADALAAIGVEPRRASGLGATMTTRYRRATLVTADGSARATVDTGLRWDDASGATLSLPALAIIETKSGARASEVDRVLWRAGHRPATVSKYATGLAALHPDLPRNRWSRLLRGPFSDAAASTPPASTAHPTSLHQPAPHPEESSCVAV